MRIIRRIIFFFFLIISQFFFSQNSHVFAANTFLSSQYIPLDTSAVQEGDIISSVQNGYILSKIPYDSTVVGIITTHPAIKEDIQSTIPHYPILTQGQGVVLVSAQNGPITKGDLITSSATAGVGMKATKEGPTVGTALENYTSNTPGKIAIAIAIQHTQLTDKIGTNNTTTAYLFAGAVVAIALVCSFLLLFRTSNKAIDAIGRNPLASKQIHIGIVLYVVIAIMLVVAGFLFSFFILKQ